MKKGRLVSQLITSCFELSQPPGIISGLTRVGQRLVLRHVLFQRFHSNCTSKKRSAVCYHSYKIPKAQISGLGLFSFLFYVLLLSCFINPVGLLICYPDGLSEKYNNHKNNNNNNNNDNYKKADQQRPRVVTKLHLEN